MKFKIEVHGHGYEDTAFVVDKPSKNRITKTEILQAKVDWCDKNDIDVDSVELPFTRITRAT